MADFFYLLKRRKKQILSHFVFTTTIAGLFINSKVGPPPITTENFPDVFIIFTIFLKEKSDLSLVSIFLTFDEDDEPPAEAFSPIINPVSYVKGKSGLESQDIICPLCEIHPNSYSRFLIAYCKRDVIDRDFVYITIFFSS